MPKPKYICDSACTYTISTNGSNVKHKRFKEGTLLTVPNGQNVPKHFKPINKAAKADRKAQLAEDKKKPTKAPSDKETIKELQKRIAELESGNPDLPNDLDDDDEDEDEENKPSLDWDKPKLLSYAKEKLSVDIPDRTNKPEILELILDEMADREE